MNRRFLYLVLHSFAPARRHCPPYTYTLHRINPSRFFLPDGSPDRAAAAAVEKARLPPTTMTFHTPNTNMDFMLLSASKGMIVGAAETSFAISRGCDARTSGAGAILYDDISQSLRIPPSMAAAKHEVVSLVVGGNLYVMEVFPEKEEDAAAAGAPDAYRKRSVEALVHIPMSYDEWLWESLPAPPFVPGPVDRGYIDNKISGYAAVGDSQAWVSIGRGGTYCLDTASGPWSKACDWAMPFRGRAEHAPELGLWFGLADGYDGLLGAWDLRAAAAATSAPMAARAVWEGFTASDPEGSQLIKSCVVHLGGGRLCVVRLLEIDHPSCQCYSGKPVRRYAVFTGVEVERCGSEGLRMIRHKSCRYSLGSDKKPVCVL